MQLASTPGDALTTSEEAVVGAHVALGESGLEDALIEAGKELHGLGVELVEVLVSDGRGPGVDPDVRELAGVIAPVVDGVVVVVSLDDSEVGGGDVMAEERDVASASGVALSLGVDANAGSPEAEDLALEGVVHLEGGHASRVISGEVSVLGGRALVAAGFLRVDGVLLLVPGAGELVDVEVGDTSNGVASVGGGGEHVQFIGAKFSTVL